MPTSEKPAADGIHRIGRWPWLSIAGYLLAADAAYLIATSRWGSYVGVPHRPVYVGDLLFGSSIVAWLIGGGPVLAWRRARRSPLLWVVLGLVAWTLVRLATGNINIVALRDAAPYVYLLAVPVAMTAPLSGRRLATLLVTALSVHVMWLALTLEGPSWLARMPHLGPTRIFELRDDFDETVVGVAIGVGVVGALGAGGWLARACWLALPALGLWDINQMTNRGGVLAALTCVFVAALAVAWHQHVRPAARRERALGAGVGLALCAAVAVGLLYSPAVHRLTFGVSGTASAPSKQAPPAHPSATPSTSARATAAPTKSASTKNRHKTAPTVPSSAPSTATASASPTPSPTANNLTAAAETAGTTAARKTAWRDVIRYTTRTPGRTLVGVGFGPNFLAAAGALELLSGGIPGLRAPHNILLNTWARLGLVGLLLNVILLALGVLVAARYLRRQPFGGGVVWVLIVIAFPTAAMFGVILEAPFGAIPYAFALGRLCFLLGRHAEASTGPGGGEHRWRHDALRSVDTSRPAGLAPKS